MYRYLILFLIFLLSSCSYGTYKDTIIKGTRIDLPAPPNPIGIKGKEGITPDKYTIIDPPIVAESYQYWRAYKDGAIIWKPKDWRIIDNHMKTSQSWIDMTLNRIKSHNKYFDTSTEETKTNNKSWYQIWK